MLHVAGSIFQAIHTIWPRKIEFGRRLDQSSMVLAGGAAGLAAAFNTPLGGIVFAVEELAKVHLSQVRTYIFHSVVIAGLLAQAALGNYLYLDRIRAGDGSLRDLLRIIPVALVIGFYWRAFFEGYRIAWRFSGAISRMEKTGYDHNLRARGGSAFCLARP
jgi:H+/Cl- antiporter ClcA